MTTDSGSLLHTMQATGNYYSSREHGLMTMKPCCSLEHCSAASVFQARSDVPGTDGRQWQHPCTAPVSPAEGIISHIQKLQVSRMLNSSLLSK
ncbi:hypothetical protein AMECASPLE_027447 [Ameca splendens]|uniref:Uncharacterized protein n=1 Tax=Ameca splendens TaxID=208324 RepID=A0ABV1AD53_9TELE